MQVEDIGIFVPQHSKDSNLRPEDVQTLQHWLKTQPHLPPLAEYQIIAFLHTCQYQLEPTKTIIDKYFTLRTHHPEIFYILDDEALRNVFKYLFCAVLPKPTPEGYTLGLVKLVDPNPDPYDFSTCITVTDMILTLYLHQYGFVTGGVVIFDCAGFSFAHFRKVSWRVVKYGLQHVQEGAPLHIKGIHLINVVPLMHKVKRLVQPFLKTELYNMINFHSDLETLYEAVPRECLPQDYGGEVESCQILQERNLKNCLGNYDFFSWHQSQQVDETKRVKNPKNFFGSIRNFFF